jgi:hypothetical protein
MLFSRFYGGQQRVYQQPRGPNKFWKIFVVYVKVVIYQVLAPVYSRKRQLQMNAYEKARELIEKIERHRGQIANHQTAIDKLEMDLHAALTEADLTLRANPATQAAQGKTAASTSPAVVKRSHKKSPVVASKSPSRTPAQKQAAKATSADGPKSQGPGKKPTLGDLVRRVILEAGTPLKRAEIQAGLQKLKYTNSSAQPYKTLGVRLHRLEQSGVRSVGNGQFDVTEEWKAKAAPKAAETAAA